MPGIEIIFNPTVKRPVRFRKETEDSIFRYLFPAELYQPVKVSQGGERLRRWGRFYIRLINFLYNFKLTEGFSNIIDNPESENR
jgi:hypothetical protein